MKRRHLSASSAEHQQEYDPSSHLGHCLGQGQAAHTNTTQDSRSHPCVSPLLALTALFWFRAAPHAHRHTHKHISLHAHTHTHKYIHTQTQTQTQTHTVHAHLDISQTFSKEGEL